MNARQSAVARKIQGKEGEVAWAALALGVLAYELLAPEGGLLSEAVDRAILKHPHLTRIGILIVAGHLANAVPDRYDLIHRVRRPTWRTAAGARH